MHQTVECEAELAGLGTCCRADVCCLHESGLQPDALPFLHLVLSVMLHI